ncbi:HAMP domain-containing sensor histidine kinase [Cellulomonas citrea]|uniref:HAMP domain-containing sensor histidine kinase n=1 Tax=Cellulomonas citrea TaxID=1909423 RepID=UPI00135882F8|nr:HAMP domain-containing sensor histidine kinase [Cellulomonas citrea]
MLRRLNVSTKVRAVLAVPMVVLLVAGVLVTWNAYQDLRYARANSAVVATLQSAEGLSQALRNEQTASTGTIDTKTLTAARAATDAQVERVKVAADHVEVSQLSPQARTDFTAMLGSLGKTLTSARGQVDNATGLVGSSYASISTAWGTFVSDFANGLLNRTLATTIATDAAVRAYSVALFTEQQAGLAVLKAPGNVVAVDAYVTAAADTDAARKAAAGAVDDLRLNGDQLRAMANETAKMRSHLANGDPSVTDSITPDGWTTAQATLFDALGKVEAQVIDLADTQAQAAERSALIRLVITFAAMVLVAVASWILANLVARSIVRPLRRLTEAAADVREQLPLLVEQVAVPGEGPNIELPRIQVDSQDEIGRLAAAFNDVNATTIQVAQQQAALRGSIAEMFVNVARRDQVLLNRQLAFVDSLERSEEDPTVLANLFHLDHLATRMRRNAESLLVLAGIDSGRRLRESMPLSDVIRTASSEIEQYDRVELDLNVDPLMLGFNALPAAHMLAELLENASVFSEPDTPVEVATGMEGQFVTVTVRDHGIGMTDTELDAVNEKLAFTSPADSLGAQRLGLFVVARLANRLGAKVTMRHVPGGNGTETLVRFPVALFSGLEPDALPPAVPTRGAEQPMLATPTLSPELEAALAQQEVPTVREVDLAALTDGSTEQGLPRRRQGVSADDESGSFVLPEAITPADIPTDLQAGGAGWAPMIVSSQTAGLPTRRRDGESEPDEVPLLDLSPAKPVDPEDRRGLFTGFRGWSRQQDEQPVAAEPADEAPAAESAAFAAPGAFAAFASTPEPQPEPEQPQEPTADVAAPAAPLAQRPRTRTRRGAHAAPAAPDADVPYGYTQDDVAGWATGQIPVVQPAEPGSDWPSPTWDSADWQPAGLFVQDAGSAGGLVPAFDPIALEPEDGEAPYAPVLEPETAVDWSATQAQPDWSGTAPLADWSAGPAEPVWAPATDPADASADDEGRYEGWTTASEGDGTVPYLPPPVPADSAPVPLSGPYDFAPPVEPYGATPPFEQDDATPPAEPFGAPVAQQPAAFDPSTFGTPAFGAPEPAAPAAFSPVFGAPGVGAPAPVEPVAETPAWPSVVGQDVASSAPAAADEHRGKKRFGLFGRKGKAEPTAQSPVAPSPAAPVVPPASEATTPVWAPTEQVPSPAEATWSAPTGWAAPPAEPEPTAQVPSSPVWGTPTVPAAPVWGSVPFEPAGVTVQAPAAPAAEPTSWSASQTPSTGRVGTLDDDVAAMLALRSDIEEQALAELSQLSTYRPSMGGTSEQLTRRVPTAMPAEAPAAGDHPIRRDADELRSRLASFQSGTSRGRRASTDPGEPSS